MRQQETIKTQGTRVEVAYTCDICGAVSIVDTISNWPPSDAVQWPDSMLPPYDIGSFTGCYLRKCHDEIPDEVTEYHFCPKHMAELVLPAVKAIVGAHGRCPSCGGAENEPWPAACHDPWHVGR